MFCFLVHLILPRKHIHSLKSYAVAVADVVVVACPVKYLLRRPAVPSMHLDPLCFHGQASDDDPFQPAPTFNASGSLYQSIGCSRSRSRPLTQRLLVHYWLSGGSRRGFASVGRRMRLSTQSRVSLLVQGSFGLKTPVHTSVALRTRLWVG